MSIMDVAAPAFTRARPSGIRSGGTVKRRRAAEVGGVPSDQAPTAAAAAPREPDTHRC